MKNWFRKPAKWGLYNFNIFYGKAVFPFFKVVVVLTQQITIKNLELF